MGTREPFVYPTPPPIGQNAPPPDTRRRGGLSHFAQETSTLAGLHHLHVEGELDLV